MKVMNYLSAHGVDYDLIPHRDTYGAQRLAEMLHVPGHKVAKTVLLRADGGYTYIVAVLPASKNIDFESVSKALGGAKIELATELEIARHCPDCEIAALPPFGSQYGMKTLVEQSLTRGEQIVFEGNTHHEAFRMSFEDFQRLEQPLVASFAAN
jgi:Ala-tRNA(Pro) deacylase